MKDIPKEGWEIMELEFRIIGTVDSVLKEMSDCPLQEYEGAPEAWLSIKPEFTEGLQNLAAGDEIVVLTWLDKADRSVLKCHKRREVTGEKVGVFSTRSPDRPNPVGLHIVKILDVTESERIKVNALEVLNGTPIIDIKPALFKGAKI